MTNIFAEDLGKLLLRVTLGALILMHGLAKIGSGPGFVTGLLVKSGYPPEIGWLVYVGEVLAPLMLIFGILPRIAGCIVAINMIAAVLLVHSGQLLSRGASGGYAIELEAIYFFAAVTIALVGGGRYAFSKS